MNPILKIRALEKENKNLKETLEVLVNAGLIRECIDGYEIN
jgi:hypothetical protein|tara:strand:+ start:853 stop:975 length:123 start_codon:yes stop_codon:yes gene_type:complete